MDPTLIIRESLAAEIESVMEVERAAFNSEEEAELVRQLLGDPSAEPRLSLLAFVNEKPAGHILFTRAVFNPPVEITGSILGPLAVVPKYQKMGVGGRLIGKGLGILKKKGVNWVFVLGHESYYPKFGFTPAQKQGFEPPYPFPEEITNPWMAIPLSPTSISVYQGKVIPAKTFEDPRYWRE